MLCIFKQQGRRPKYQIHLNSQNGPICVLLVNHDTSSDTPVVVPVPPVEQAPPSQQTQTPLTITDVKMEDVNATSQKKQTELIKGETIDERLESMIFIEFGRYRFLLRLSYFVIIQLP